MKLFKKLAAAALAAVLALSMVGCGNASGVNSTKQFILNMMNDMADLTGTEYNNTPDMDGIAQKLLTETDSTIAEIAHQIGYENPNKFSSAFRQSFGMTPTQYRKMRPIG